MPKEIAHIYIAAKAAEKIPDSSVFHKAVQQYKNLFLYGSFTPDVFYYYLAGPDSAKIQKLSAQFHTYDHSCLEPVRRVLNTFGPDNLWALSFAAGVCCHLAADTVFHPIVYFYSGLEGIHAGATARHRDFETAMDVYYKNKPETDILPRPYRICKMSGISNQRRVLLFQRLLGLEPGRYAMHLNAAAKIHQWAVRLFAVPWAARLAMGLTRHPTGSAAEYSTLFYPAVQARRMPFFDHPVHYRNSETGRGQIRSMGSLTREAAALTIDLLAAFEKNLLNGKLTDLPEISPCPRADRFRYWFQQNDIRNLIWK